MKTTFTTEQLHSLYKQVMQYCVAAYNEEPYTFDILESGEIEVFYSDYVGRGEYETRNYIIQPESLSQDLEEVYNERKKKEEEVRIKCKQEEIERQKLYDAQQKEKRKQEYLKLKQEFES